MMEQQLRVSECIQFSVRVLLENSLSSRLEHIISRVRGLELFDPELVRSAFIAAAERALQADMLPLLMQSWSKLRQVRRAIESGDPSNVGLYKHSFRWAETPEIQLMLDEVPLVRVPLEIRVDVEVSGVMLVIEAGAIQRVTLGQVSSCVAVTVAGQEIVRRELGVLELPNAFVVPQSQGDDLAPFRQPQPHLGVDRFRPIPWA